MPENSWKEDGIYTFPFLSCIIFWPSLKSTKQALKTYWSFGRWYNCYDVFSHSYVHMNVQYTCTEIHIKNYNSRIKAHKWQACILRKTPQTVSIKHLSTLSTSSDILSHNEETFLSFAFLANKMLRTKLQMASRVWMHWSLRFACISTTLFSDIICGEKNWLRRKLISTVFKVQRKRKLQLELPKWK